MFFKKTKEGFFFGKKRRDYNHCFHFGNLYIHDGLNEHKTPREHLTCFVWCTSDRSGHNTTQGVSTTCSTAVSNQWVSIFAADNFVSFESTPSKDFPGLFQPDLTARRWKAIEFTLHRYLCCDSQDLEVYCTAYGKAQLSADAPKWQSCPHKKPTSPRLKDFDRCHLHSPNMYDFKGYL